MGLNTSTINKAQSNSTICSFYLTSEGCKFGKKCQFVHLDTSFYTAISAPLPAKSQSPPLLAPAIKTVPCKFFIKGKCKYGSDCRFLHKFIRLTENQEDSGSDAAEDDMSDISSYSSSSPPSLTQTDDLGSVSELGDDYDEDEGLLNEVYQFNLEFNGGSTSPLEPSNVITICNYHLRNKCKFGDQCRNKHINRAQSTNSVTPAPSPLAAKYFFEYEREDWGTLLEDALSQPIVGATSTVAPTVVTV